jgi:SH3-like domain-containing protein
MEYKKILFIIFFTFSFIKLGFASDYRSIKEVTSKANLRAGPGRWYPIKWVIKKPGLPIKIIDENEDFLHALLHDGTRYWIYKDLTDNKQNLIVIEDTVIKNKKGLVIAKVLKDVIIKEHNCSKKNDSNLCRVEIDNIKGLIYKSSLWGYSK